MKILNINIKYDNLILYKDFNIEIQDFKINCIIGKSGCGKTTLLNFIMDTLLYERKKIAYVFQEDSLIPWKNIYSNLEFTAKQYLDKDERKKEINKVLEWVELSEEKNKYPNQLSGGMRQRVNIARALIGKKDIIIMDEPFKSIDNECKEKLIGIIKQLNSSNKTTIILVTHDMSEVEKLADNIFILHDLPVKYEIYSEKYEIKNILSKIEKIY